MLGIALQTDIHEMIEKRELDALRDSLQALAPSDIAEIIGDLPPESGAIVFRVLPRSIAGESFAALPLDKQEDLLKSLSMENVATLLNEMPADDRTRLLEELPGEVTKRLLNALSPEERKVAQTLLGYPEESIGRLMTPDFVALQPEWTVARAMEHIREVGIHSETVNVVYVVDKRHRLLDDLKLRELVIAAPEQKIEDLLDYNPVALLATDDQEVAVRTFKKYYRVALPVTDSTGVLVGIVTLDDVLNVAEAEATEDIQKLGGMQALDEPYLQAGFGEMIRKRAGWLVVLFLGEMLTASVMGFFEEELARAIVLSLFIPLIISSGGNAGSQAASLIIRALAVGEVTIGDWWRIMKREIYAGMALGGILGLIGVLRVVVWSQFSTLYGPHYFLIALTVGTTLVAIVLWGTLVGSMLPLLLRRAGLDPAVSSAPFVATLVDVLGLAIYFLMALLLLSGTVLKEHPKETARKEVSALRIEPRPVAPATPWAPAAPAPA